MYVKIEFEWPYFLLKYTNSTMFNLIAPLEREKTALKSKYYLFYDCMHNFWFNLRQNIFKIFTKWEKQQYDDFTSNSEQLPYFLFTTILLCLYCFEHVNKQRKPNKRMIINQICCMSIKHFICFVNAIYNECIGEFSISQNSLLTNLHSKKNWFTLHALSNFSYSSSCLNSNEAICFSWIITKPERVQKQNENVQ